jgi:hypothetical protein
MAVSKGACLWRCVSLLLSPQRLLVCDLPIVDFSHKGSPPKIIHCIHNALQMYRMCVAFLLRLVAPAGKAVSLRYCCPEEPFLVVNSSQASSSCCGQGRTETALQRGCPGMECSSLLLCCHLVQMEVYPGLQFNSLIRGIASSDLRILTLTLGYAAVDSHLHLTVIRKRFNL